MTCASSSIAAANPIQPVVVTQTQDDDIISASAPSPVADDPRVSAAVRERHLLLTQRFDAAYQSRCSRLVTEFLLRKTKVQRMAADVQSPTDAHVDVAEDAASAARALLLLSSPPSADTADVVPLPSATNTAEYIQLASEFVWRLPCLRPIQAEVLQAIFDPTNRRHRLVVAPTAIGKSHIIRMMGTIFKAIHLVIHPLLALTADQVNAFKEANEAYGAFEVHNMDMHASKLCVVLKRIIQHT